MKELNVNSKNGGVNTNQKNLYFYKTIYEDLNQNNSLKYVVGKKNKGILIVGDDVVLPDDLNLIEFADYCYERYLDRKITILYYTQDLSILLN